MTDQGFREINLDSKQLVFLFMTAAVVLVVAFLCGVLVGRGVRNQEATSAAGGLPVESVEEAAVPAPAPPAPSTAAPLAPPPSEEDLSYLERLEGQPVPGDTVSGGKPASEKAAGATPATEAGKPAAVARPAAPEPSKPAVSAGLAEPAGQGFQVQVTALRDRPNAESVARRLASKGHTAYVLPPTSRSRMFRVVVGKFKTREEAEQAKRRLEREEKFKPWIIS